MRRANPRIHWAWWLLAIALFAAWQYWPRHDPQPWAAPATSQEQSPRVEASGPLATQAPTALPGFLPAEARTTITLIQRGGPFPYRQDGGVFGNREGHLPSKPRGWYHEYTVDTPGLSHRGARRIITGGNPPSAWYYTSDHYDSFRAFDPGTTGRASP